MLPFSLFIWIEFRWGMGALMANKLGFIVLAFFQILFLSAQAFSGTVDRSVGTAFIQGYGKNQIEISSISISYMQVLFEALTRTYSIPFRYPDDGCFARAHKTALLLEDLGIVTAKSFIIGDLKLYTNDSPKGFVNWWYHVAPIVHIKEIDDVMIFDPTSSKEPLTKAEWVEKLTSHKYGSVDKTFETERYTYRPEDADKNLKEYQKADILYMKDSLDVYLDHLMQRRIFNLRLNVS